MNDPHVASLLPPEVAAHRGSESACADLDDKQAARVLRAALPMAARREG